MQHKAIRLLATGVVGLLILASSLSLTQPALAQTENQPKIQTLDFSNALIRLEDLPGDFGPLGSELIGISAEQMLGWLQPTLITDQFLWSWKEEGRFIPAYAPSYGIEEMVNLTGYTAANAPGNDSIFSWLKPSLSRSDQEEWDIAFTHSDEFLQNIIDAHDDPDAHELPGYDSIGDTRFAYTYRTESSDNNGYNRYERVRIRRGPVLIEIKYGYLDGEQPLLDLVEIARLLDDRVADVVGRNGTTFRPAGPLVPELTTYIPTPLDVSPEPGVIGTNLLLAALLMLPFAVAAELFTRTLGEHENALQRFRLLGWLSRLQKRLVVTTGTKIVKRPALRDTLKLIGVVIFYGLVFSLLDRTWNPFSLQGLILFLSMTIAYGVVGIADDIIQWRAIRKWGLAADLTLRPTNLLLAMGSTATSRLLSMVPGLMFGTPEALRTEESQFDDAKRNSLLKISAITFIIIGLGVWLPTIATAAIQKTSLSENILNVIGGVEGFLLVIFAVTLENLFVQMLGFPGGFGQALKRRNKWLWLAALTGVTFLFYHTLINPRGELAEALQQANIWLFFGIAIAFVIFAFSLHFYLGRQRRVHPLEEKAPTPSTVPQQIVASGPSTYATPTPVPTDSRACPHCGQVIKRAARLCRHCRKPVTPMEDSAPAVLPLIPSAPEIPVDSKQCPKCKNIIKLEALLCRFCKARFDVAVKGYCPRDHQLVVADEKGNCPICRGELTDKHIVSTLIEVKPIPPIQPPQSTRKSSSRLWGWLIGIMGLSLVGGCFIAFKYATPIMSVFLTSPVATSAPVEVSIVELNAQSPPGETYDTAQQIADEINANGLVCTFNSANLSSAPIYDVGECWFTKEERETLGGNLKIVIELFTNALPPLVQSAREGFWDSYRDSLKELSEKGLSEPAREYILAGPNWHINGRLPALIKVQKILGGEILNFFSDTDRDIFIKR